MFKDSTISKSKEIVDEIVEKAKQLAVTSGLSCEEAIYEISNKYNILR